MCHFLAQLTHDALLGDCVGRGTRSCTWILYHCVWCVLILSYLAAREVLVAWVALWLDWVWRLRWACRALLVSVKDGWNSTCYLCGRLRTTCVLIGRWMLVLTRASLMMQLWVPVLETIKHGAVWAWLMAWCSLLCRLLNTCSIAQAGRLILIKFCWLCKTQFVCLSITHIYWWWATTIYVRLRITRMLRALRILLYMSFRRSEFLTLTTSERRLRISSFFSGQSWWTCSLWNSLIIRMTPMIQLTALLKHAAATSRIRFAHTSATSYIQCLNLPDRIARL